MLGEPYGNQHPTSAKCFIRDIGTAAGAAFVSGTTATVFLRCQGTGNLTVADIKSAAEGATGGGSGTFTVSVEAIFAPAL